MLEVVCGEHFIAVPHDSVCMNGIYLKRLNTRDKNNLGWHLVDVHVNRAVDGEGGKPHVYRSLDEARKDAAVLTENGEWSYCGGVHTKASPEVEPRQFTEQELKDMGLKSSHLWPTLEIQHPEGMTPSFVALAVLNDLKLVLGLLANQEATA